MPSTLTFVVADLAIAPDATGTRAHGLDLDGYDGETPLGPCTSAADFVSLDTGTPGVDNQMATFASTAFQPGGPTIAKLVHTSVSSGSLLLVIALDGIDGLDDPVVQVRVARVATAGGGPLALDGAGLVAPGQTFAVLPSTEILTTTGTLHGGRLGFALDALPLPWAGSSATTWPLHHVRVEATLDGDALAAGDLAGVYLASDCVGFDAPCNGFDSFLDLDPVASGVATSYTPGSDLCAGVSAGFGFHAVPAALAP